MVLDKCVMKQENMSCSESLLQAKDLEAKFFASLAAKGVLDASVRNICSNIRHLYESIILADPAFAEVKNVEDSLWQLHYMQIEEFRHHICSDKEWTIRDICARTSLTTEKWRELLQSKPVLTGFRSFLTEASGFYHELILKLKANCGLAPGLESSLHQKSKSVKFKRCQQSCYRCLVNLGDYARYKEFYVGNDPFSYDFSMAADFYREAIAHWPVGGQPHNQLAVLAVYVEDDLLAVYHYFRSLAVEKPFPTTRENLTILFEKNRVKYEDLSPAPAKLSVHLSRRKTPEKPRQIRKLIHKNPTKTIGKELINQFFISFVRLNGLFFTKTSLEKFEEVYAGVLYDLQQLLALDDKDMELALGSGSCFGMARELHGSFGALKLVVILICTLENVIYGSKHTEAPMQKILFQNAFKALLSIVGHFMQRCAEAHHASGSPLLPAVLVFLEWLTCRPDILLGVDKNDEQFNLLSFIWKQFMRISSSFSNEDRFKKVMQNWTDDSKVRVALWEDFELQGFSPLSSAHALLNGERFRCKDMDIAKDQQFRCCRLVASGYAIANIAEGSSLNAMFGQAKGKVHKFEENSDNGRQVTQIKEQGGRSYDRHASRCDEDDGEELIVFQPAAKEQLLFSASSNELLSGMASEGSTFASSPCALELHNSPNPECLPDPSSLYATDTIKSAGIYSHLLASKMFTTSITEAEQSNKLDTKFNSKQANMPFFKQSSRNDQIRPSLNPVKAFELRSYMGSRKANSLGVIGQPKQIQTCTQEGSSGLQTDTGQFNEVSRTFKQEPPSFIFKEKLNNDFQGNSSAGITSNLVESVQPLCKQSSCNGSTVMRPPPGFGPRPTKPPMSLKWSHLHGEKGLLQRNRLLEESKHSSVTPFSAEKHKAPPGYSSSSAVSNKVLQSEIETQPSLSSLPLLSHSGSTAAQQSFQMASDKETWSLFGSTAGYNWTPTLIS